MLASRLSQAWLSFARTGKPSHRDLPPWPQFDEEDEPVMTFNDACGVWNHPDAEARRLIYGRFPPH
jgi:para-nitrobenzyl esterase